MITPEEKIADAAYTNARATVDAGEKIIAAIDRNTEAIKSHREWTFTVLILLVLFLAIILTTLSAKAAPLVSDGDEIASVGTEVRR